MAIPDRLNAALVLLVLAGWVGLVWAAGRVESPFALAGVAIAFALLFQTNFALFHEASHLKLHSRPWLNRALGWVCGALFGYSASMFEVTHWSHHLKNRSDAECFDVYYPHQSRLGRTLGWYGMLLGLLWPATLALSFAMLVAPWLARWFAERAQIADKVFAQGPSLVRRIRVELVLAFAAHGAMLALVATPWPRVLLLYGCGAVLWSSTQYLEHAYAPREVVTGAFNLHAPFPYGWVNLHRELDLDHHLRPEVPWIHLPALAARREEPRRSWLRHWVAQLGGPRLTREPGPAPLTSWPPP